VSIHTNDDGTPNVVTYLFTDLHGNRIEELPITGVTFSLTLNASGAFSGTLNISDPRVQAMDWDDATAPNKACVWVDIGGTLVYGGVVVKRTYQQQQGTVTIQGADHWTYLTQRLQAKDYTTTWATTATGAAQISHQVLVDVLAVANSLPISLPTPAATPSTYGITLSAPLSQRLAIGSIVQQLSSLGWQVGFDFAVDVAYVAGVPTASITLSYPRRGRVAGTTGLLIDTATASAFTYDEDGQQQATSVAETATGTGGVSTVGTWQPAMQVDGYPLLERVGIHSSFSTSYTPQAVLNAYVANDLALSAYPVVTPQVTVPLFGNDLALGDFTIGDDVRVIVPKAAAGEVPPDPRFPNGMDFYWRIVRADCTIPTEGLPTMQLTLNIPPSSTPQRPPH